MYSVEIENRCLRELKKLDQTVVRRAFTLIEEVIVKDPYSGKTVERDVPEDKREIQILTDEQIVALSAYCKKIEDFYKFPQDIEWAVEKEKIYILQSRPVTALEKKEEVAERTGTPLLTGYGASPGIASGIVKIIRSLEELNKIEKNYDIIQKESTSHDLCESKKIKEHKERVKVFEKIELKKSVDNHKKENAKGFVWDKKQFDTHALFNIIKDQYGLHKVTEDDRFDTIVVADIKTYIAAREKIEKLKPMINIIEYLLITLLEPKENIVM